MASCHSGHVLLQMSLHIFILKTSSFRALWILKLQIRDCGSVYLRTIQVSKGSDFITKIKEKQSTSLIVYLITTFNTFLPVFCLSSTFERTISQFIPIYHSHFAVKDLYHCHKSLCLVADGNKMALLK